MTIDLHPPKGEYKCKHCKAEGVYYRKVKIFCNPKCKSAWHNERRATELAALKAENEMLKKNRRKKKEPA